VIAKEFEEASSKKVLDELFQKKKTTGTIKIVEYLKMDRALEIMMDEIKESINLHQKFLDLVRSRDTTIESLHTINLRLQKQHKKVDYLFEKVQNLSFKFSSSHLLPYAMFKNYSQNEIYLCN